MKELTTKELFKLVQALRKIRSGISYDLLGTTSMSREEMQEIAKEALKVVEK